MRESLLDVEQFVDTLHEWRLLTRSSSRAPGVVWVLMPISGDEPEWRFRNVELATLYANTYDPEGNLRDGADPICEDC